MTIKLHVLFTGTNGHANVVRVLIEAGVDRDRANINGVLPPPLKSLVISCHHLV
jgi:hypothetical protein